MLVIILQQLIKVYPFIIWKIC
ncbi:hypothetical protein PFHG_05512 [Plasmodium falciparum HB3]|uniref:Uncharacterized protein n=1 Tax=Plasmodium falciparum (isolate HB3) TaxID=137071 RepID=A0A0L7KM17_PLAFX|nr:hypothetical protein PFHG_05512 [Plasmodium falciparum HB3]